MLVCVQSLGYLRKHSFLRSVEGLQHVGWKHTCISHRTTKGICICAVCCLGVCSIHGQTHIHHSSRLRER